MKANNYLRKLHIFCVFLCIVVFGFTGCRNNEAADYSNVEEGYHSEHYTAKKVSLNSDDYASDSDVDSAVKSHVIGEAVECEDKVPAVEGYTYHYASTDRDLHFDVNSVLRGYGGMPNAKPSKMIQTINVNYAEGIRDYYWQQVIDELEESDLNYSERKQPGSMDVFYESFSDLEYIAEVLSKVDDIYKKELQYNTEEFLKKYPLCGFHMKLRKQGEDNGYSVTNIDIDGSWTQEALYKNLVDAHSHDNVNGEISDPTIPDDIMELHHKDALYDIYIDDINILDEAYYKRYTFKNAKRRHGPAEDAFYSAIYNESLDTYLILLDIGPVYSGNEWETVTETYLETLTDKYLFSRDENIGTAGWVCEGDKWAIITEKCKTADPKKHGHSTSYCFLYRILKNNEEQAIECVLSCDEGSHFGGGMSEVSLGIPIDAFAKMFNLTYEIDENKDDGCVYFKTK